MNDQNEEKKRKLFRLRLHLVAKILIVILITIFLIAWVVAPMMKVDAQNKKPFQQCITKAGGQPINIIWDSGNYLESMIHPPMIAAVLDLTGDPIIWDADNGAHLPDDIQLLHNTKTISLTLNDGTLVSFIINQWYGDQYYGWMTYSTYRTAASYNPQPNPHVLCEFWSISIADYEQLRTNFLAQLIQYNTFEDWMR